MNNDLRDFKNWLINASNNAYAVANTMPIEDSNKKSFWRGQAYAFDGVIRELRCYRPQLFDKSE